MKEKRRVFHARNVEQPRKPRPNSGQPTTGGVSAELRAHGSQLSTGIHRPGPLHSSVAVQAGDVVIHLDRHGRIIFWNDEAERVFGYAEHEAAGRPFEVIFPASGVGADRLHFDLGRIMAGRDFAGGFQCVHRNRKQVAIYLYATAGRDKTGRVAGVVCIARDVTQNWRAEQAARASEEKYGLLLQATSDAVVLVNRRGRIIEANRAASEITGFPQEALIGKSVADLVPPPGRRAAEAEFRQLLSRPQLSGTLDILTASGGAAIVEYSATAVMNDGNRFFFAIARDVTERVRTERLMRESEEKYRRLFAALRDAMYLETLDGSILDVNESACRMLGYTREELLRLRVEDIIPAPARAGLELVRDALLQRGEYHGEAVNVRRDGTEVPVDVSCSLVELEGRTLVLALARDATERIRAARALRESEANFRELAANADDAILIALGPQARHVYVNQRACEITGYTAEELLRMGPAELGHPDERAKLLSRYQRRLAGEPVPPQYETKILRKDGTAADVEITAAKTVWRGQPADLIIVRDISDRKRAEAQLQAMAAELRRERDRAKEYLDVAEVMLVALNRQAEVTMINRKGCQVLGRSQEEIIGRNWVENFVPESQRKSVMQTFVGIISGDIRPDEYYENPVLTADGSERVIAWHNALLRDEQGNILGTLSSGEDITERRQAENALAESQRRLATLLANLPGMAYRCRNDPDWTMEYASEGCFALTGYRPDELVNSNKQTFSNLIHPADRPLVDAEIQAAIAGHEPFQVTYRLNTREGLKWVWEQGRGVYDQFGKPVAFEGFITDITERKRAQARLAESEAQYRALFDLAPDGIAVHQDGRVVLVNRTGAAILGYDRPDEMIGLPVMDFVHPDDRELVMARIRLALEQGRPAPLAEERFRRKDGTYVWVAVVNSPFVWQGRPAVQVVVRDISERKRLAERVEELSGQMKAMFEQSAHGIAVERDGRLVYVNSQFTELLGYSDQTELLGRPFTAFAAEADGEKVSDHAKNRLHGQETVGPYRFQALRRDGTIVELENIVSFFELGGHGYLVNVIRPPAHD
ncbi:MAG: PAS domain S-box protein [candidate division WOR-3 bacterium]